MRKSKLENPQLKKRLVEGLVRRESQQSIAEAVGVSQSQISRFSRNEELKPFIEQEYRRLMACLPDVVENMKTLVGDFKGSKGKDRELGYKAGVEILKAATVLPTQNASTIIQNIYHYKIERAILEK